MQCTCMCECRVTAIGRTVRRLVGRSVTAMRHLVLELGSVRQCVLCLDAALDITLNYFV